MHFINHTSTNRLLLPKAIEVLIGLMMIGQSLIAQQPMPYHLTQDDFKLRDPEGKVQCYDIVTDSLGYVYLASVIGLYQFEGTNAYQLTLYDGFRSTPIVGLHHGAKKKIWANTYSKGIGVIEGDSLVPYIHNDSIKKLWRAKKENLYPDRQDTLHLGLRSLGYVKILPDGTKKTIWDRSSGLNGVVITHLHDGKAFHFSVLQRGYRQKGLKTNIYYLHQNGTLDTIGETLEHSFIHPSSLVIDNDGSWVLSNGNKEVIKGKRDSIIYQKRLPSAIVKLFIDSQNTLWIGTINNGIYRVTNDQFSSAENYFENTAAAATAEDPDGGIWIKTTEEFFKYIPNPELRKYTQKAGQLRNKGIDYVATDYTRVFALLDNGEIAVIENDSIFHLIPPKSKSIKHNKRYAFDTPLYIKFDQGINDLVAMYFRQVAIWDGNHWEEYMLDPNLDDYILKDFVATKDGTFYALTFREIQQYKDGQFETMVEMDSLIGGLSCIKVSNSGELWVGSQKGIWKWDGESLYRPEVVVKNLIPKKPVEFIRIVKEGIWVQIIDEGLYFIKGNKVIRPTDASHNNIQVIDAYISSTGELWGREKGSWMHLFQFHAENDSFQIRDYPIGDYVYKGQSDGGCIAVLEDDIYMGSGSGLFKTKTSAIPLGGVRPRVKIRQVFVNQKIQPERNSYHLKHNQNSIYLVFEAIMHRYPTPSIRCRLIGFDSNWTSLPDKGIQYANLKPGEYLFQLQARRYTEPWGPMEEKSFYIETPYWQTWWFITLETLGGLLIILGLSSLWFSIRHKRATLQIEKLKAEQRALRAQMNPHFIFNALSSIQDLVFSEDRIHAVTNIALFAKLMRKILAHSSMEAISLAEEIQTLNLYLKLEALRFEDRFEYDIQVDESINVESQMVPPIFIQPFVENAIKHGLLNKKPAGGSLNIRFKSKEEFLLCSIEDDGVGREKAEQIKAQRKTNHRSFSTNSVHERIQLLNTRQGKKIKLSIVDLFDQQKPAGTRIELLIPKRYAYDQVSHH